MTKRATLNGADALVATLESLGVRCVFGLPGTQNVELFESLRRSEVRTVLAGSEAAAGFMANGWFRAGGQPAVFITIQGPGFAWSLPPLAEASHDSAAMLMITGKPPDRGHRFDLQHIDQRTIAEALKCLVFDVDESDTLEETVRAAWLETTRTGPRPVILQVSSAVLREDWTHDFRGLHAEEPNLDTDWPHDEVLSRLERAKRPVIFAGGGTLGYSDKLERLVESIGGVFVTTPTARGVIDESHPMCVQTDFVCDGVSVLNKFLESSDLVLALGCRFSHNGTGGFGLKLEEDKLIHVDVDPEVLQANYPARWPLCVDVGQFLDVVLDKLSSGAPKCADGWKPSEIEDWRNQMRVKRLSVRCEPVWEDHGDCQEFFCQMRAGIPKDGVIVTDTGLHQILARTYLDVHSARGLIFPSDFQSMGFGLPAAIGASLSSPNRAVGALIGDGSLLMVGTELLTAKREALPLPVLVFCDGSLGQIRLQQLESFGHEAATRLEPVALASLARAFGIEYVLAGSDLSEQLRSSFSRNGPTLFEVRLKDSGSLKAVRNKVRKKNALKAAIGPGAIRLLKRLRRRNFT